MLLSLYNYIKVTLLSSCIKQQSQSRTLRFQIEVLLTPTVGLATEVNMKLLISIPVIKH